MTEEEAKTRWCPAAGVRAWDRPMATADTRCIAASCMAWRWSGEAPKPTLGTADFAVGGFSTDPQARKEVLDRWEAKRPGYCGLAGPCAS
jgi:hypothetical protein